RRRDTRRLATRRASLVSRRVPRPPRGRGDPLDRPSHRRRWEGNLPRSLPEGTGASIDRASWEVPAIFSLLARLGDLEEMEQFDTWNMGIGLVVAIPAGAVGVALRAVPGAVAPGAVVQYSSGRRVIFG